jgi:hypothetical protein
MLVIKLLIFIEFSSVLNTRFMELFNVTLGVNVVFLSIIRFSYCISYSLLNNYIIKVTVFTKVHLHGSTRLRRMKSEKLYLIWKQVSHYNFINRL